MLAPLSLAWPHPSLALCRELGGCRGALWWLWAGSAPPPRSASDLWHSPPISLGKGAGWMCWRLLVAVGGGWSLSLGDGPPSLGRPQPSSPWCRELAGCTGASWWPWAEVGTYGPPSLIHPHPSPAPSPISLGKGAGRIGPHAQGPVHPVSGARH